MNRISYAPSPIACWFHSLRPKTLTAAIVPFLTGAALAYASGSSLAWGLLFCALISSLCIQIATNLINDAFDFAKGTDNESRLGPLRAIHYGITTSRQVHLLGLFFFLVAFLFGIPLIMHGGPWIALVLFLSMLSGYFYTGGPFPLAYIGVTDFFIIVFFGWVATMSGFWLQAGYFDIKSFLLGTQIGLLCTLMSAINNLRDINSDEKNNKRTLAVRFGQKFAKIEIILLAIIPYVLNAFWLYWQYFYVALLPLITIPLACLLILNVWRTYPSKAYNGFLALAGLLHFSFGFLLIIGFVFET